MQNETAAIKVKDLRMSYGDLEVLKGLDLTVTTGQVVAVLGPNGAGKTTLIKILSTLLHPNSGIAEVAGHDVLTQAPEVRTSIGLTGQYAAVDEYLTGRENLIMMGRLYHLPKQQCITRSEELLKQFGLLDAADRSAKTYSGGMRRRLDLAASLIATPPIIFLDEPTTGLDPRSRIAMWDVIKQLVKDGTTILLTTQYLDEADQLADKIAVIDHGKVIAEGTSDELKAKVGAEYIEFVIKPKSDFETALKVAGKSITHQDEKRRTITLASKRGVKQLKDLLNAFEDAGVELEGVSLHKPTLDDVFLTLTGKSAAETKEAKDE